ncbi:HlyD family efflux transporter periplasmic adaptor subunit [Peribacillus muralis]|uniref:efflux RND transporter periplasmic adaptor subunit n=1 Tax=Peribacillus muralis TaxID=264697 RepID=UPI001F4D8E8D|nr:efflux RND transporter periplasmic adaptor subunit [Peribacillus muralis]MCK1993637.1 efflux RND transporter periplasmic adaptor subunit [Peribacillus muralis]MCK2014075.1 efflux RND transporter periplasmic adaptor subunit [Peribacillus muralis]
MRKDRLLIANILGVFVIIALLAAGAYFYYQNENFVKTDDAKVSAEMFQIVAPASGMLKDWDIKEGNAVTKGDAIGTIDEAGQTVSIKLTMGGTIIKSGAGNEQLVQGGQVLAQAADLKHLYITANIKETDLKDIEKGDSVDINVDGDTDVTFEGKVEEIGYATKSVFSALPESNTGNFTKVTQKVSVKISIMNPSAKVLPGMNAKIKISL